MRDNHGGNDAARPDDGTAFLEKHGFDKFARSFDETDTPDDNSKSYRACYDPPDDDLDERIRQNAVELEDIRQAAQRDEDRAKAYRAAGEYERAEEAEKDAHELRQLAANTARQVLRVHDLFSEAFSHAVNGGHWHIAQAHLLDAIRSNDADHALKIACAKALAEIASFAPQGDDGGAFDGQWLANLSGIPLRTAQDLVESARSLESGVASILTGTEHGSRKAVRDFIEMTPARQRELLKLVRTFVTRYLIEQEIKKEKRQRSRNISITELRALTVIRLNNEEGWNHLLSLDTDAANTWLENELNRALDQRHQILSEVTMQRGRDAATALRSRRHRNRKAA
jgi:hypothetical protein